MFEVAMKKTHHWILLTLLTLVVASCRKDVEEVRPYPVTVEELKLFLQQVPDPATKTTIELNNLSEDKVLTTPAGIRVYLTDVDQLFIATGASTPTAASTCDELNIEITAAFSRGDIMARGIPTIDNDGKLLETRGMVSIRAFCGATELNLLPGRTIKIQFPSANPQEDMFTHEAVFANNEFQAWRNTGQQVFKADWSDGNGNTVLGYEMLISSLGWSNCARQVIGSGTPFCTSLMPGFTGLNTQSYLVFDGIQSVVPLKFDDTSHSFCFPSIPPGYPVRVVSVAKLGTDFWYGKSTTETGTNTVLPVHPEKEPEGDILSFLRGL